MALENKQTKERRRGIPTLKLGGRFNIRTALEGVDIWEISPRQILIPIVGVEHTKKARMKGLSSTKFLLNKSKSQRNLRNNRFGLAAFGRASSEVNALRRFVRTRAASQDTIQEVRAINIASAQPVVNAKTRNSVFWKRRIDLLGCSPLEFRSPSCGTIRKQRYWQSQLDDAKSRSPCENTAGNDFHQRNRITRKSTSMCGKYKVYLCKEGKALPQAVRRLSRVVLLGF